MRWTPPERRVASMAAQGMTKLAVAFNAVCQVLRGDVEAWQTMMGKEATVTPQGQRDGDRLKKKIEKAVCRRIGHSWRVIRQIRDRGQLRELRVCRWCAKVKIVFLREEKRSSDDDA